ncbi:MAG: hypothetical protein OXF96_05160, partial [Chloroflexi bacterium]|nr:hypothetical protein [Chloroflexota bacterium]
GGIVALAADRYSSLPPGTDYGAADVADELDILQGQLRALQRTLGDLGAYQDFSFLLERMAEQAYAQAPAPARSGYSR